MSNISQGEYLPLVFRKCGLFWDTSSMEDSGSADLCWFICFFWQSQSTTSTINKMKVWQPFELILTIFILSQDTKLKIWTFFKTRPKLIKFRFWRILEEKGHYEFSALDDLSIWAADPFLPGPLGLTAMKKYLDTYHSYPLRYLTQEKWMLIFWRPILNISDFQQPGIIKMIRTVQAIF